MFNSGTSTKLVHYQKINLGGSLLTPAQVMEVLRLGEFFP
jgi:hypothetical protein